MLLDLGPQPVSSHFTRSPSTPVVQHSLTVIVCDACGVVQLAQPFPFKDLIPPYEWMTYREPEAHLDAVVERIWHLPGVSKNAAVGGITFKDATTLERMRARGCSRVWSLDLHGDLSATDPNSNIESVQALLTPAKASKIVERRGPVDVLIARHIVEHAEAPSCLLQALATLIAPSGYLIIEVPDCRANLARQDYTMIWEEHDLYLTSETAPQLLALAGCVSRWQDIYPFPFEDVIVLYAQKVQTKTTQPPVEPPAAQRNSDLARRFASSFDDWTRQYQRLCADLTKDGRKLAAYGAGHLTSAFLNFHDLAAYFAFVVDDTPHKQGLFLPKSGLSIVPRTRLIAEEISACFFGLTPQIEDKIIANNVDFVNAGGRFYSMMVDSKRSIRNLVGKESETARH
jgi:C-methyltransferase C-terminal domain